MNTFKQLRQEKGLTQAQLAEILSLDQTTVSKWELGKALPDSQMLIRLAKFFDVSTDFLLGISNFYYPDQVKISHGNIQYSSDEQNLIEHYRKLPSDLKHRASTYMSKLVELLEEETNNAFHVKNTHSGHATSKKTS